VDICRKLHVKPQAVSLIVSGKRHQRGPAAIARTRHEGRGRPKTTTKGGIEGNHDTSLYFFARRVNANKHKNIGISQLNIFGLIRTIQSRPTPHCKSTPKAALTLLCDISSTTRKGLQVGGMRSQNVRDLGVEYEGTNRQWSRKTGKSPVSFIYTGAFCQATGCESRPVWPDLRRYYIG
jgi:hypothetical protein